MIKKKRFILIAWKQCHNKTAFFSHLKEEFLTPKDADIINVSDSCEELLDLLESRLCSAEETVTTIKNVL